MEKFLSISELAVYVKLSKSTLYKKTMDRTIPFIKTSRKLLFKKEAIDEWLEQHAHQTVSDIQEGLTGFLKPSKNQD